MKLQQRPEEPLADIYASIPLGFDRNIPVFSEADEYIDNYEKIARDHLAFLNGDTRINFPPEYFVRQTESSTASLLRKHAEPGMKILDVGVSRGYLLSYFPDLDRYGLDISLDYLEIARSKGIEVCYSRIEDMPYKKDVFDLVVCTDVLEHVFDLNLCCRQLISVLKPNGVLIVRVPYLEDLSPYLDPGFPYKFVHFRTFDVPSLRLLFEKIFDCTVSELVLAGYFSDERRRKHRVPFPSMEYVLARLSAVSEEDRPMICEALLQNWYEATEINAVVIKARTASDSSVEWCDISRAPRIAENKPSGEATRVALEKQLVAEFHHNSEMAARLVAADQTRESTETLLREVQKNQTDTEERLAGTQRALEDMTRALENTERRLGELQNSFPVRVADSAARRWRALKRLKVNLD